MGTEVNMELLAQWDNYLQQYIAVKRNEQIAMNQQHVMPGQQLIPGANYGQHTEKGLTVFLMGDMGTWKTTWGCQWPNPFYMSIASEGGDDALDLYPRIALKLLSEAKVLDPPPVFNCRRPPSKEVRSIKEVYQCIEDVKRNHKAWNIHTFVCDSVTSLVDLFVCEFTAGRRKDEQFLRNLAAGKREYMTGGDWGAVNNFLKEMRVGFNNIGINLIYTSLVKPKWEPDDKDMMKKNLIEIEPFIQGGTKITLPSACKMHISADNTTKPHPNAPGRLIAQPTYWTVPSHLTKTIRNKYYDAFPLGRLDDPDYGSLPTFRGLWNELGKFVYLGS